MPEGLLPGATRLRARNICEERSPEVVSRIAASVVGSGAQHAERDAGCKYSQYQVDIAADIAAMVEMMGCQPILFIGSGLSKRYFAGPSWDDLLAHLAASCPLIQKEYAYYKQTSKSPLVIGEEFARLYQE